MITKRIIFGKEMKLRVRNILVQIFRLTALLHHVYSLLYPMAQLKTAIFYTTDERVKNLILFSPIFFSTLNLVLQMAYFYMCIYHDILDYHDEKPELREKLKYLVGYIFNTFMIPFATFIIVVFWVVFSLNREWVLPAVLDQYVPIWLNHFYHTNVFLFVVIEMLIGNQQMPSFGSAFKGMTLTMGVYHFILILVYFATGKWVYILFAFFTWPERIAFFTFNYIFAIVAMTFGIIIQNYLRTRNKSDVYKVN